LLTESVAVLPLLKMIGPVVIVQLMVTAPALAGAIATATTAHSPPTTRFPRDTWSIVATIGRAVNRGAPPIVVLTFDNLGEAAEQERGTWRGPIGEHPSVTVVLPLLLELLDELSLRATFFVEAVNTERYPDAAREIAARGHEVGQHAWAHERWGELDDDSQTRLLERSRAAFAAIGVATTGFRPPGGQLSARSLALFRAAGITWCSPEGSRAYVDAHAGGVAVVPFRWPLVDATYLYEPLAGDALLSPADAVRRLESELERERELATLVLHPFLLADDEIRAQTFGLLRRLTTSGARIVPGRVAAEELRARS
jgi:peptidoglycan/xylan/chitin deacetylase (PgdA/CDA1 family)